MYYLLSQYWTLFFSQSVQNSESMRFQTHVYWTCFFLVLVGTTTSQNIPWAARQELILHSFRHFTYVTTHSPSLSSLYLRHSSFSNPSVASPTSQFFLQPFFRFPCVTGSSLMSPGEPHMIPRYCRDYIATM